VPTVGDGRSYPPLHRPPPSGTLRIISMRFLVAICLSVSLLSFIIAAILLARE
jgi:hypothetical protein